MSAQDRFEALMLKRELMMKYLDMKRAEEDWHGVQDAASDIREIDAVLKAIDEDDEP